MAASTTRPRLLLRLGSIERDALAIGVATGASQFVVVGVLGAGGGVAAAVAPALLLAGRNALYGLSLVPVLRTVAPVRRAFEAQLVIDESTAMARAHDADDTTAHRAFLATGLSVYVLWNLGTLAGALLGGGIGDPRALGLDAMFPAAFLALLVPQLRRAGAPAGAVAGVVLSVALVSFTPAGVPILAAALGVVPAVLAARLAARRGGVA